MSHIHNPQRYEAAIQARIKMNARMTRKKKWLATYNDAKQIEEWLCGYYTCDESDLMPYRPNSKFLDSMMEDLQEWGQLTERQTEAVRNAYHKSIDNEKKYAVECKAKNEKVEFVGDIKERREFILTVKHVHEFCSQWGVVFINICEDQKGNPIVCKGGFNWEDRINTTIKIKATIKAHDIYKGLKQTVINRPKILIDNITESEVKN